MWTNGTDPEKDISDVVKYELYNNIMYIKREPVHGFWTINFDKGQIPGNLKTTFTTLFAAKRAVEAYLKNKGREPLSKKD